MYLATLGPKGLAHRLTQHCATDSEKVVAIHHWITHHIKHDARSYYSHSIGKKPKSLSSLLRRRKAIFGGFSELFATLCQYSGVSAVVVSGYAKGRYYDQNDFFYRANHAWNAVKVKDEWLLVDAAWDAGEIQFFKRSLRGHILHFISFGKLDHIEYRPHFVRNPTTVYRMRNGPFMRVTHLPEIPIWQLLKPIQTVQQMEQDSSFYFGKVVIDSTHLHDSLNPMRDLIAKVKPEDRYIEEGHQAFAFNHRNHEAEARAFHYEAISKFNQINVTSFDSTRFYTDYNLCQKLLKNAALHYDTSMVLLGKERASNMTNLGAKEGRLKSENQELIRQTKKVASILTKGMKQAGAVNRICEALGKNLYSVFYKIEDFKKFNTIPTSRISKKDDSIRIHNKVNHLLDSASRIQQRLTRLMLFAESNFNSVRSMLRSYEYSSTEYSTTTKTLTGMRMQILDDRDYLIRLMKDDLILKKKESDAELFKPDKVTIGAWCDSVLAIRVLLIRLNGLHKLADQECVNLRRSSLNADASFNLKKLNLSQFGSMLHSADNFLNLSILLSKQLQVTIHNLMLPNAKEAAGYGTEKRMGLFLYGKARAHFNAEYIAGKIGFLQSKRQIRTIQSVVGRMARSFEKFRKDNLKKRRRS